MMCRWQRTATQSVSSSPQVFMAFTYISNTRRVWKVTNTEDKFAIAAIKNGDGGALDTDALYQFRCQTTLIH